MVCSNTTVSPWVLPIVSQRFVSIELGSPPQHLSVSPSVNDSALILANAALCDYSDTACAAKYGYFYASSQSTTWHGARPENWNGSQLLLKQAAPESLFNDDVHVAGSTIHGFPTAQADETVKRLNRLGIYHDSDFLSVATAAHMIPSQSWGIWTGLSRPDGDVGGSLVIGGFDQARVQTGFTRFDMYAPDYPTRALIRRMEYTAPNGTRTPFLISDGTDSAVLNVGDVNIRLASTWWKNFAKATNIISYPTQAAWGWPAGIELGNVSITFGNGYTTTLSASDLWGGPAVQVQNASVILSRVSANGDPHQNILGYPFFASNYMTFHSTSSYFELAAANGDPAVEPNIQSFCDSTSTQGGNGTSPGGSSNKALRIAGPVIGGLAALALAFVLFRILLWYRSKVRGRDRQKVERMEMVGSLETRTELPLTPYRSELPSTEHRAELGDMPHCTGDTPYHGSYQRY